MIFQFSYIYHCHRQLVFAQFDNFLSILFLLFRQEFLRQKNFDLLMLSNSNSTLVAPYFSRSSKSRLSYRASRPFVCRFVRVGFVRPNSYDGYLSVDLSMSFRVGLFVGTSSRMPIRISVFVIIPVGFVYWKVNSKKCSNG